MERHNIPYDYIVDQCKRGGPNCLACRTLGKPKGSDNNGRDGLALYVAERMTHKESIDNMRKSYYCEHNIMGVILP